MNDSSTHMAAQCKIPVCSFNCCNSQGLCPADIQECHYKDKTDPIWLDILIGVIAGLVVIGAIVFLVVRARKRMQNRGRAQSDNSQHGVSGPQEVELATIKKENNSSTLHSKLQQQSDNPFKYVHPRQLQYLRTRSQKKRDSNPFIIYTY